MRRRLPIIVVTVVYTTLALCGLGSRRAPTTSWRAARAGDGLQLDLGSVRELTRLYFFFGVGRATWEIALSDDGASWRPAPSLRQHPGTVFKWTYRALGERARYVRMVAREPGAAIHEIAAVAAGEPRPAAISAIAPVTAAGPPPPGVAAVIDEQALYPERAGFASGTIFDEVYFARTAFEHLHGLPPFELSHPPLGKLLIAAGIALFGFGPFGWRVVPALAGAAMLPLTWALGARLTGRPAVGLLAACLLACDFLHFTHSRMATVDVFVALFTLLAFLFMVRFTGAGDAEDQRGRPRWLVLSGLSFAAGIACKWSAAFAGPGLATLFLVWLRREHRGAAQARRDSRHGAARAVPAPGRRLGARRGGPAAALAWALLAFAVIPAAVYLFSYVPFLRIEGPGYALTDMIRLQRTMFAYHRELTEEYQDSSRWWEWPLIRTPVRYEAMPSDPPSGTTSLIVGMGNPAIWWPGILAVALAVARRRGSRSAGCDVVLLAFASVYLPWALVPRHTFLYHFFPAVPFLVLTIAMLLAELSDRGRFAWKLSWAYAAAAAALFAGFYPILAGRVVSTAYVETFLRWFARWPF